MFDFTVAAFEVCIKMHHLIVKNANNRHNFRLPENKKKKIELFLFKINE